MLAFGHINESSPFCDVQGIFSNAGYLSAAFFTVVITYQLWHAVHFGKIVKDVFAASVFCWVVPWVLAVLPLTTNNFGDDDGGRSDYFLSLLMKLTLNVWQLVLCHSKKRFTNLDQIILGNSSIRFVDHCSHHHRCGNAGHDCETSAIFHIK